MEWKMAGVSVFFTVPSDAEAVTVGSLDAESGVEALVDQGVLGPVEQLLKEDRGSRVSEPTASRLLLLWVLLPLGV
jgi:hypothetical protein